jgi:hypothetical protein
LGKASTNIIKRFRIDPIGAIMKELEAVTAWDAVVAEQSAKFKTVSGPGLCSRAVQRHRPVKVDTKHRAAGTASGPKGRKGHIRADGTTDKFISTGRVPKERKMHSARLDLRY